MFKFNKIRGNFKFRPAYVVPVLIVFAILGAVLLIRSFAAISGVISFEPERGTVSGAAGVNNDQSASGGQFVTFRPSSPNLPPPPGPDVPGPGITEPFKPRVEFGARLEPKGKVLHGAGQVSSEDWHGYATYVTVMDDATRPILSSEWTTFSDEPWFQWHTRVESWKAFYSKYGWHIVPLVGIPFVGQTGELVSGSLDGQILQMCDALKAWGRPVYLRPFIEFNGPWNGFTNYEEFKQAYRHFVTKSRACGLTNVAFIWDADSYNKDWFPDPMLWYPGDEYVDWFGWHPWYPSDFVSEETRYFFDLAASHRKPVMIGETTARYMDVRNNSTWNEWFVPYFNFIRREPVVKGYTYINWNWGTSCCWQDWGNSDISTNATLSQNVRQEVRNPGYFNSTTPSAFDAILRP